MALAAFAQDFEVWKNKRPCFQGLFVQGDGPFRLQRIWYKQFYNPRATQQESRRQVEGVHVARGLECAPEEMREASHEALRIDAVAGLARSEESRRGKGWV